jgi:tetratricopeptide (TPR) repeat protein
MGFSLFGCSDLQGYQDSLPTFYTIFVIPPKRSLKDVVDEIDNVNPLAKQLFEVGQAYHNRREWSDAERYFNDTLKQEPNHFRANLLLGETLLSMGRLEDAVRQLEIAYSIDNFEAQYPLARVLMTLATDKEKFSTVQDLVPLVA